MAYSTLVIKNQSKSKITVYGILDLGNKKFVKVEYTDISYIRPG